MPTQLMASPHTSQITKRFLLLIANHFTALVEKINHEMETAKEPSIQHINLNSF